MPALSMAQATARGRSATLRAAANQAASGFTLAYSPGAWAEAGRLLDEMQAILAVPGGERIEGRAIARREPGARNVATDAIRCVLSPTPEGAAGLRLDCAARGR